MSTTCLEKFKIEHPKGPLRRCPHNYGYAERPKMCYEMSCKDCWNREYKGGDKPKDEVH